MTKWDDMTLDEFEALWNSLTADEHGQAKLPNGEELIITGEEDYQAFNRKYVEMEQRQDIRAKNERAARFIFSEMDDEEFEYYVDTMTEERFNAIRDTAPEDEKALFFHRSAQLAAKRQFEANTIPLLIDLVKAGRAYDPFAIVLFAKLMQQGDVDPSELMRWIESIYEGANYPEERRNEYYYPNMARSLKVALDWLDDGDPGWWESESEMDRMILEGQAMLVKDTYKDYLPHSR